MELTRSYETVMPASVLARFELREVRNAAAVIRAADPQALEDLIGVLEGFELTDEDVLGAGGSRSDLAIRLDEEFRKLGWREARVDTRVVLEARLMPYHPAGEREPRVAASEVVNRGYKTDNFRDRIALDVEWNAKDGNLDRDLSAYRSLYAAALIDAAVILTRTGNDMRDLARRLDPDSRKFGTTTTTNLAKLQARLSRGDGGGCPVLAVAITSRCYSG